MESRTVSCFMQQTNLVNTNFTPANHCNIYWTTSLPSLFLKEPKEEQIFLEGFDHVFKYLKDSMNLKLQ